MKDLPSEARERGSALVLAMLLIVLLVAASSTIASGVRRTANRTLLDRHRAEALAAAEAGVEFARLRLSIDPSWPGTDLLVGAATVSVEAVRREDGACAVVARAENGLPRGLPVRLAVEAVLRDTGAGQLPRVEEWRESPR